MARDAEAEAARGRAAQRAAEHLEGLLQHKFDGVRVTEVRMSVDGGAKVFVVLKGVQEGVPCIGFRSLDDVVMDMPDLYQAVKEKRLKWKNDEYPNKLQRLLSE